MSILRSSVSARENRMMVQVGRCHMAESMKISQSYFFSATVIDLFLRSVQYILGQKAKCWESGAVQVLWDTSTHLWAHLNHGLNLPSKNASRVHDIPTKLSIELDGTL